ncbi:hypothetical protein BDZ89DRAFT_1078609, partial [Hymenopellis radicata]
MVYLKGLWTILHPVTEPTRSLVPCRTNTGHCSRYPFCVSYLSHSTEVKRMPHSMEIIMIVAVIGTLDRATVGRM